MVLSDTSNLRKTDGAALAKIWGAARTGNRYASHCQAQLPLCCTENPQSCRTNLERILFASTTAAQVAFCLELVREAPSTSLPSRDRTGMIRTSLLRIWANFSLNTVEASLSLAEHSIIRQSIVNDTDLLELLRVTDLNETHPQDAEATDPVTSALLQAASSASTNDLIYTLCPFMTHIVARQVPRLLRHDRKGPKAQQRVHALWYRPLSIGT